MATNKVIERFLSKLNLKKLGWGVLITLPVIAYVFRFAILNRHGIFHGEDWDYFAQSYEAARLTITHYHQFPWWNPWENGGQPLFANPQFGLFSIQMPLVLLFGTVAGLHYSLLVYFILGFWGMYSLLRHFAANHLLAVLLAYIWIFSGFNVGHLAGGQFTFTMYLISPWAFLAMLNINKRRGWLWFGLVASLMILTAMHYITFEVLLICTLIAILQISRRIAKDRLKTVKALWTVLKPYVFALVIILLLCGIRLFFTLQFTKEFTRFEPLDSAESLNIFIASLLFHNGIPPAALGHMIKGAYGWIEYADYFGLTTAALFVYLVIKKFEKFKTISLKDWLILIAIVIATLITLGDFAAFSPYTILHNLPIFNQMRVPYRFVGWVVVGIIVFLTRLPHSRIVYALLGIAVIDLFFTNFSLINYSQKPYHQAIVTANERPFEEYDFYGTDVKLGQNRIMDLNNLRLLRATQQNAGEIYGYEPILNIGEYYYLPGTAIYGVDLFPGSHFVQSNNAKVSFWSPNRIVLKRSASGPIRISMNPGKVWLVNGKAVFANAKILELQVPFIINDPAMTINITYHPAKR